MATPICQYGGMEDTVDLESTTWMGVQVRVLLLIPVIDLASQYKNKK